ncbi:MAG: collagen-like protein, partial [Mariniphaga sp.]
PDFIKNKPTIPEAQVQSDWNELDTEALDYIKNKPEIPDSQVQSDWNEADTEALDFIQNKPDIPDQQIQSDWLQSDSEALDYIKNKPDSLGNGGDGVSSYTYIAYASDDAGTDFTKVFNPALDYIAIKTTTTLLVTPVVSDFTGLWKNYKGPIGDPGTDGLPGGPGSDGLPGADGADDHSMDVYIDFLSVTPFVYNCPYALKFTSQISEGTGATLSVALNTNLTQFQKLTVTPSQIGLIILKGTLL